jgi:hypothetical protein
MNVIKIAAILLIVMGVLSLVYGKFSYTKATRAAKLGPVEVSVKDLETLNVPAWFGAGAIGMGTVMLFVF